MRGNLAKLHTGRCIRSDARCSTVSYRKERLIYIPLNNSVTWPSKVSQNSLISSAVVVQIAKGDKDKNISEK